MAARVTSSASGVASSSDEDSERCLLLALSHDELGVIVDGLADPLQPVVAVTFSSTCKGLRTPLETALGKLAQRYLRALGLCGGLRMSCAELADLNELWRARIREGQCDVTFEHFATLGMLLPKWLPRLQQLGLEAYQFGDVSIRALCAGLGPGAAPSLRCLSLGRNKIGPAGAEALAAALFRGAMPNLEMLHIDLNPIGNQGVAALATLLRKRPAFKALNLGSCGIGDEGVASLVANLGKDDFKKLEMLYLYTNQLTDVGCATLIAALKSGAMPELDGLDVGDNAAASDEATLAVDEAVDARWKARNVDEGTGEDDAAWAAGEGDGLGGREGA